MKYIMIMVFTFTLSLVGCREMDSVKELNQQIKDLKTSKQQLIKKVSDFKSQRDNLKNDYNQCK